MSAPYVRSQDGGRAVCADGRGGEEAAAWPAACRPVRPLSPEDLSILALETQTVAGHTCKVIVLRDRIGTGQLRSSIAARLDRAPEFRLRLGQAGGELWWLADEQVDLAAHVAECGRGPVTPAGL